MSNLQTYFMATKDYDMTENKDMDKKHPDEATSQPQKMVGEQEEKRGEKTEVKNAHASGDGSFGRNDSSVPDEDDESKKGSTPY